MATSLGDALGSDNVKDDDTLVGIASASQATHIYVYDEVNDLTYLASIADMKALLAPAGPLPVPAAPTFTNFQDTQAGGSVVLVPAPNTVAADYLYRVGANGLDQPVPANGVLTVGNIDGSVYAYLPASSTHAQGATAASPVFTSYTAPLPVPVISFTPIGNKTVGDAAFSLTASSTNTGTPITFTTSDATHIGIATASNPGQATVGTAGAATITATQAAGNGYAAATASQTVTVATQTAPAQPVYDTTLSQSVPNDPSGPDKGECTLTLVEDFRMALFRFLAKPGGDPDGKRMDMYIGSSYVGAVDFPVAYVGDACYIYVNSQIYKALFANTDVTFTLF